MASATDIVIIQQMAITEVGEPIQRPIAVMPAVTAIPARTPAAGEVMAPCGLRRAGVRSMRGVARLVGSPSS